MDTLLFALMLASLLSHWRGRRVLGHMLSFVALVGVALLLSHHMTESLPISL